MKKKYRRYIKLNLVSLIFIVLSLISVTFAWFAYSGLSTAKTEIPVKAWYIKFSKNGQALTNDINITLDEIYPGMETVVENVDIENKGDSDAMISYEIKSVSILDDYSYEMSTSSSSSYVEDKLSHDYPFHININLTKGYADKKEGTSTFSVSFSWPLDSGDNEEDSKWGNKAYEYAKNNSSSIKVVINLKAEQLVEDETNIDSRYNLGDTILYNPVSNSKCSEVSTNCYKTTVLDVNNKKGDNTVTLGLNVLEDFDLSSYTNYQTTYQNITSGWQTNNRSLKIEDILKVISTDIKDSVLFADNISNRVIGNLNYENRLQTELSNLKQINGKYLFNKSTFSYLASNSCYWLDSTYSDNTSFAVINDGDNVKVYNENNSTNCKIIPVLIVNKTNLN